MISFSDSSRQFISKIVSAFSGFFLITIVSRELGPETLGSYVLFMAVFGILSLLSDMGVNQGLTKRLSERSPSSYSPNQILGSAVSLKIVLTLVLSGVVILLKSYLERYLRFDGAVFMVLLLICDQLYTLAIYSLRGEDRVGESATVEILQKLISRSVGIAAVFFGLGLQGLIGGIFVGRVITGSWGVLILDSSIRKPTYGTMISIVNYSKYSVISSLGGRVFTWGDTLIIGLLLSQSSVGVYEIAWRVAGLLMLLTQALTSSIFPKISALHASGGNGDKIKDLLEQVSVLPLLIIIPGIVGGIIIGEELLVILFEVDLRAAWAILVIHLIGKMFQTYHMLIGKTIQAMDRPDLTMNSRFVSIFFNLVSNFILIWAFGVVGAAIATTLSIVLNLGLNYRYLSRFFRYSPSFEGLDWILLSTSIMAIVVFGSKRIITLTTIPWILTVLLLGVATYVLCLFSSQNIRNIVGEFILSDKV